MRTLFDRPSRSHCRCASTPADLSRSSPADEVTLTFPSPVAGLERLFDQVGILSSKSPKKEMATLGPFYVAQYKPGSEVDLSRNSYYWKRDQKGLRLPRVDSVRLSIQQNREMELIRFQRGSSHMIRPFRRDLRSVAGAHAWAVRISGRLSNQMMGSINLLAPIGLQVVVSIQEFRRALSAAVNREDMCKSSIAHACPAEGPISSANRFWFMRA